MPEKKQIRIKPTLALLCDHVRQEANGKPFIIGIYTSGITIQKPDNTRMPAAAKPVLSLALWVAFEATEAGQASIEFLLVGPDPKRRIKINAQIEFEKAPPSHEISALAFDGLIIPIERSGELEILFKHKGDSDWHTLRTVPVTLNENYSHGRELSDSSTETEKPS